jgi:hypothetical protein
MFSVSVDMFPKRPIHNSALLQKLITHDLSPHGDHLAWSSRNECRAGRFCQEYSWLPVENFWEVSACCWLRLF